jgi:hypothetical protein
MKNYQVKEIVEGRLGQPDGKAPANSVRERINASSKFPKLFIHQAIAPQLVKCPGRQGVEQLRLTIKRGQG